MTDSINRYIKDLNADRKTGKATEHSYRPALKTFLESLKKGIKATNEPTREQCGAPDFIIQNKNIPIGYIECKDIIWPLDPVEKTEQLKRYLSSLNNLILTNYLEFRYYVQGERKMTVPIARIENKDKIKRIETSDENLLRMFNSFFTFEGPSINTPKDLAERMAKLAQLIRDTIHKAFEIEDKKGKLHGQFEAFKKVLLNNLTEVQFADMYAQTICYGLFAARCNASGKDADKFTREHAAYDLPKTNPFLREVFGQIAGPDLDESITWVVDDLAELLRKSDISSILADFGKATKQEDPVVHFYETFLSQYDPKMRESRGVYYTPEPVVSYIVRSVDHILKTDFGLKDGLADATMIKHEYENPETHEKVEKTVHKVQILDPAVGTGTFLHGVINQIHESFKDNRGMWSGYVSNHLLPRLYGFELLMAPYAVAHMKLGLQLRETGYDFQSNERLRVYLTNTLEEAHEYTENMFANLIAEEANRASEVKKDVPVMVVLGNPPYSANSVNKGNWISELVRNSYYPNDEIKEYNLKLLLDDYVKFIRFAQYRIEQTGYGILAFISNHAYLDNPTFRSIRENLMSSFDKIYLLDLHGNLKKKEKCPDGGKDENVFDIQQGVTIGIFVKNRMKRSSNRIKHQDIYGLREYKYDWLMRHDVTNSGWVTIKPEPLFFLFQPFDSELYKEYSEFFNLKDIMQLHSTGIKTHRDSFVYDFEYDNLRKRINEFRDLSNSDSFLSRKYDLKDTESWSLRNSRQQFQSEKNWTKSISKCLYRPFDFRYLYFHNLLLDRSRNDIMRNLEIENNLALITVRQVAEGIFNHVCVTNMLVDGRVTLSNKGIGFIFPLYIYYDFDDNQDLFKNGMQRVINLTQRFVNEFSEKLKLSFVLKSMKETGDSFGPEDIFHYIYAIFHSPTYRTRYAEFLKIDFPRVPLTSDVKLFRSLCALGEELVGLHLMEKMPPAFTNYPIKGDDIVEKPVYVEPQTGKDTHSGRVYINKSQYFDNVPAAVWEFHIGGYQVCHKWLKDRKGRQLSYDDINHYRNIVVVLHETMRLMQEIDKVIPEWPIE